MLAAGFVLLATLVAVTSNTRAVISPFYEMKPLWVFFAICAYAAGFTFSKSLTTTTRFFRPFSLAYFFLSVFFVLMFIWPNSNAFDEPIIRGSSGMFALLFLSVYGGVLCGDVAQSDALGDAYFRAHVLPQLQSNNPPISLLCCDLSGEYQLIDSKSLNIQWNAGVKELQLNGYPLLFYAPVFVDNRHLTCAREKVLGFINNQPRTKREAMKHYIRNINLGQKRFQSIYTAFHLGIHQPLALCKPNQVIELQRSNIRIEKMDFTIQWSVPERAWSSMFLDGRPALIQAMDPTNQFPAEEKKTLETERQMTQQIMPDFCEKNPELGVFFHRSFINFLLAFRRGEFQPEARMRIMLAVSQWVLDYRRRAPPRPPKKSTARTVSIDEWQRIEQLLETESVSLFMRMYNWLNDYAEKVGQIRIRQRALSPSYKMDLTWFAPRNPFQHPRKRPSIFHWTEKKYRRRRLSYIQQPSAGSCLRVPWSPWRSCPYESHRLLFNHAFAQQVSPGDGSHEPAGTNRRRREGVQIESTSKIHHGDPYYATAHSTRTSRRKHHGAPSWNEHSRRFTPGIETSCRHWVPLTPRSS